MTTHEGAALQSPTQAAPTDGLGIIKQPGPGLIISAVNQVGEQALKRLR